MAASAFYVRGTNGKHEGVAYLVEGQAHPKGDEPIPELLFEVRAFEVKGQPRPKHVRLVDYIGSDCSLRLCSGRMREAIDPLGGPNDGLRWDRVKLLHSDAEVTYWSLRLPDFPDVLDPDSKCYLNGGPVRSPVLSADFVKEHRIFRLPGPFGLPWFVDREAKKQLARAKLTGCFFEPAST